MIETTRELTSNNGMNLLSKKVTYIPKTYVDTEAVKKDTIVSNLSESDQMNLMATLVEQIGDLVMLDTPEFAYAKTKFAEIKTVLNNG